MIRRRIAAVLSTVMFAQLAVVNASPACVRGHGTSHERVAHRAGVHGGHAQAPINALSGKGDDATQGESPPCSAASMCVVVMLAPRRAAPLSVAVAHPGVGAVNISALASISRVPAVPPPRG